MTEYLRVPDLKRMGFSQKDADRIHRRAMRKHGAYKPGDRFTYVTREAVEDVINEARVETT